MEQGATGGRTIVTIRAKSFSTTSHLQRCGSLNSSASTCKRLGRHKRKSGRKVWSLELEVITARSEWLSDPPRITVLFTGGVQGCGVMRAIWHGW